MLGNSTDGISIQGNTIGGIFIFATGIFGSGIEKSGIVGQGGITKFNVCCWVGILGSVGLVLSKAVWTVLHLSVITVTTGSIFDAGAYNFVPDKLLEVLSPSPKSIAKEL